MRDALKDWKLQQISQPRPLQPLVTVLPDSKFLAEASTFPQLLLLLVFLFA